MKFENISEIQWCSVEMEEGIVYIIINTWHDIIVKSISNELEQVLSGENNFKTIKQHVQSHHNVEKLMFLINFWGAVLVSGVCQLRDGLLSSG